MVICLIVVKSIKFDAYSCWGRTLLIETMDKNEFISLILPLRDRLFRIAWHIVRSREEAEDIVQDVMVRVWKMEGEVKRIGSVEAYCYTMAKNLALNRLELKGNGNRELDEGKQMVTGEEPQGAYERSERLSLIQRFMEQLPMPQRDIIQLRDIEGMSYGNIATTLGVTEEQVKIGLFRARKKIKELYLKWDSYGLQGN